MDRPQDSLRDTIRQVALAVMFVTVGFLLRAVLKIAFDIEMAKWIASLLNFALAAFGAFVVFPRWLKQPFGAVSLAEYCRRLGFYLPSAAWKHIALGVVLALCTLGGMLAGSLLSGQYVLDWNTVTFSHVLFSLNPGVWEEFFYRGIIMAVLVRRTRSPKWAVLIQVLLFALMHIKGADLWSWLDVLTVALLALAFTYAALKTRVLLAGIVFHFLHDVLLFLVQVPGDADVGLLDHVLFYFVLWAMTGVACLVIKIASDRLGVQAKTV
jgi:membrane protease YdiL (CAAX protease family)